MVDDEEAAISPFGSFVAERIQSPPDVDALCVRTDDIDLVCDRLDLEPISMSRENPDGRRLAWRLAGLERALVDGLPFFIQWEVPEDDLPARAEVDHGVEVLDATAIARANDIDSLHGMVGRRGRSQCGWG